MVTSHKMNENEMGYRGSKSKFVMQHNFVKEQRVDGSCFINKNKNLMKLRYTLMGFEKNYQIKIPSKQLNNRSFFYFKSQASRAPQTCLSTEWFITGLVLYTTR